MPDEGAGSCWPRHAIRGSWEPWPLEKWRLPGVVLDMEQYMRPSAALWSVGCRPGLTSGVVSFAFNFCMSCKIHCFCFPIFIASCLNRKDPTPKPLPLIPQVAPAASGSSILSAFCISRSLEIVPVLLSSFKLTLLTKFNTIGVQFIKMSYWQCNECSFWVNYSSFC